jgi:hypothetical protein
VPSLRLMPRWVEGSDDSRHDVWKAAARHNDVEAAYELCARACDLTIKEARVLVDWYVNLLLLRRRLLDPTHAVPAHT